MTQRPSQRKSSALLLFLCALSLSGGLRAQTSDGGCLTQSPSPDAALRPTPNVSCTKNQPPYLNFFKWQHQYIPDNGQTRPATVTKKFKLRFVIAENNNTGPVQANFRPQNQADLELLVTWMNMFASSIWTPVNPATTTFITDERIRFELTEIEYINDPIVYNTPNAALNNGVAMHGKYQDSILNVYFFREYGAQSSGAWTSFGHYGITPGYKSRLEIFSRNMYKGAANSGNYMGALWGEAQRLFHEFHHCLGLGHLQADNAENYGQDPAGCSGDDYLSDCYPTGCPMPYSDNVTTNVMNSSNTISYVSPLQMGRVHRSSFLGIVSQYLYPTEAPDLNPWIIKENQTWDFPIHMYQDIRVKPGYTLTIKCEVQMPPNGRIVVERGGKLILDGGHITSYHGKYTWKGIELLGNVAKLSDPSFQASIEMKNGAIIENAIEGLWNFSWENGAQGGGIIRASNSTFYNCWRAVGLNDYRYYGNSGNCSFNKVSFIIDDKAPFLERHQWNGGSQFTSYATINGVSLQSCLFRNEIPLDVQPQAKRGQAIYTLATGIGLVTNTFDGFRRAVYTAGYTGNPTGQTRAYNNIFTQNSENLVVAGDAYGDIRGNNISNMYQGSFFRPSVGIYLDNTSGTYVGCNNTVNGSSSSGTLFNRRVGLIANNTRAAGAVVENNNFTRLSSAAQTQRTNNQLVIACNKFNQNNIAMSVNPEYPGLFKHQGNGCAAPQLRAGNVFSGNVRGITSSASSGWQYYAFKSNSVLDQVPNNVTGNVTVYQCNFGTATADPNPLCKTPWWKCAYIVAPSDRNTLQTEYLQLVAAGQKESMEACTMFGELIRAYNIADDVAGLQTFLEGENDDNARRLLIPLYLQTSQYSLMNTTIDNLTIADYEQDAYRQYFQVLANLQQGNRDIRSLTPDEEQLIRNLSSADLEVAAYAKALLEWAYDEYWDHVVENDPEDVAARPANAPMVVAAEPSKLYDAIPNPARGRASVQVYVNEDDARQQPSLVLYSIEGRQLARFELKAGHNNVELNTSNFPTGVYFYSFMLQQAVKESKKLSVQQ